MACSEFRSPFLHGLQRSPQGLRLESLFWAPTTDELLEPVAVGSDEVEDAAAELARSVQIVSPLPDQICRSALLAPNKLFHAAASARLVPAVHGA
jgi:hypothetical protein